MLIIQWCTKAKKQFEKIRDVNQRNVVYTKIGDLRYFPNCSNIKMLKSYKYDFRLRVGKYRVLFNVLEHVEIVSIEEIKKRDEQTY